MKETLIFTKGTDAPAGRNRRPQAFEYAISGVDTETLTKTVTEIRKQEKKDAEGNVLYLLAQADKEVLTERTLYHEVTEDTGEPAMETVVDFEVLSDEDGNPVQYEVTEEVVTPAVIDEETGEVVEAEKRELVPTGELRTAKVRVEKQVQKKDEDGNPLFIQEEILVEAEMEEVPPIEITAEDERYTEDLLPALVDVEVERSVLYKDHPHLFTAEDVIRHKEASLHRGTLYGGAVLFETFEAGDFEGDADFGRHSFTIHPGGSVISKTIPLKSRGRFVKGVVECDSEDLQLYIGLPKAVTNSILPSPMSVEGEQDMLTPVDSVVLKLTNSSAHPVRVEAISVLA